MFRIVPAGPAATPVGSHFLQTMSSAPSLSETFLQAFHEARPGLTSKAYGDLPAVFRGQQRASSYALLTEVIPRSPQAIEVLDLACGEGHLLGLLAARRQHGLVLNGVDMNAAELALARGRLGGHASLTRARAQALPYPAGTFDGVLCHMALMLMDELDEVMRELRRVLRPGGRFAAVVGAMPPESPALRAYLDALSRRSRLPQFAALRLGDRRLRSPEGIREVFASGFDELLIEEVHLPLRLTPAQLWDWLLDMYDLQLLGAADRELVERELMQTVSGATGPDGMLDFPQTLRFLSARAV